MAIQRKPILDALEARLATIPAFKTKGGRVRMFDQVPPSEQPAFFIQPTQQVSEAQPGRPTRWTINVDVVVYCHDESETGPAATLLDLIDQVEAVLEPKPDEPRGGRFPPVPFATTLGGLVSHCRIAGAITTDEGFLGPQAVAVIPVEISTVA